MAQDIAAAGNGGTSTANADGGAIVIGDLNTGGNSGGSITVGDVEDGAIAIDGGGSDEGGEDDGGEDEAGGGGVTTTTDLGISADGGTGISDASGGDDNFAFVS